MLLSNGVFTQPSTSALASASTGDGTRGSRGLCSRSGGVGADQTNRSRAGMSPASASWAPGNGPQSTGGPAGPAALGCPPSQTRRLAYQTPTARSEVVEAAVPPGAGGEACGARARLSRGDDLEAAPGLVEERCRQVERPLLVGRQAVAPQAALGEALQLVRQLYGFRQRRPRLHEPVGEAHALGLVARHAAAGEDEVEGVAVAEQAG